MTTIDHRAAAEEWLAKAEFASERWDMENAGGALLLVGIARTHALLAEPVPTVVELPVSVAREPRGDAYWEAILSLPLGPHQYGFADEMTTIRECLTGLLSDVWEHRASFNGKRPYGNSDWEWSLYEALALAGYALLPDVPTPTVDTFSKVEADTIVDTDAADELIAEAIAYLGRAA